VLLTTTWGWKVPAPYFCGPRHLTYVKDGIFGISKRPFNIGEIKSFTLVAMTEYTYI
jgi:hypothetical protein